MLICLSSIKTEDERAFFTELYGSCRQEMFRTAFKYLRDASDSEDIVQEIFCIVADEFIEKLSQRDDDGRRRFLFVCTRNRAINLAKRKSKFISLEALPDGAHELTDQFAEDRLAELVCSRQALKAAFEAIRRLDPIYSDVLWMRAKGFSIGDISLLFNEKADTVKKRLYRGRTMLDTMLGKEGGEER